MPQLFAPTRRDFIKTSAAAAGASMFPFATAFGQTAKKFVRLNVNDPGAVRMLASYKKAIRAMLALPPADPRNWYRHTLIHTLDCPHGNWWFLVWHRAYIGWFEQTCREMSGDPDFAFPYWDWTENTDPSQPFKPRIPEALFDDVLTPGHPAFIASYTEFEGTYRELVGNQGYWSRTTPFDPMTQYGELLGRGVRFNDDLWFDIANDPRGRYFYEAPHARGLTPAQPYLDEETAAAVSSANLYATLAPDNFIAFASPVAPNHSTNRGFGPLEAGPHNLVHNNVGGVTTVTGPDGKPVTTNTGGFMQDLMSPVDPIFFLHHSNMDRLWDVWTRKQQNRGLPTLPDGYLTNPPAEGTDYYRWSTEPFLFFVDAQGQPVAQKTAGDYASIGRFNYEYQPGSGEDVVPVPPSPRPAPQTRVFAGTEIAGDPASRMPKGFSFVIPAALLQPTASHDDPSLIAKVTAEMPVRHHAGRLRLFVNAPAGGDPGTRSPSYAGSFVMFSHRTSTGEFTFTLPLAGAIAALRAQGLLNTDAPLVLRVYQEPPADAHGAVEIRSIVIEVH
jgi:tyrosinase